MEVEDIEEKEPEDSEQEEEIEEQEIEEYQEPLENIVIEETSKSNYPKFVPQPTSPGLPQENIPIIPAPQLETGLQDFPSQQTQETEPQEAINEPKYSSETYQTSQGGIEEYPETLRANMTMSQDRFAASLPKTFVPAIKQEFKYPETQGSLQQSRIEDKKYKSNIDQKKDRRRF